MLLVHGPFVPTPDSSDRESKDPHKNFQDMIQYMDKCVGRLIDGVKEMGVDKDTLILFCSDNGTNRVLKYDSFGKTLEGKKGVPHDRGTHSPLIALCPDTIPANTRTADLIDFSDILPTLAEIGQATLPERALDGRSFWPQCLGEKGNPREWIFQYYWPKAYSWIPDELGEEELIWVHNAHYKLHGNGLFYDIKNDREETTPISQENRTEEQQAAYKLFTQAISSMPSTNPHYQEKLTKEKGHK